MLAISVVYLPFSLGHPAAVPIAAHRVEVLLTLLQGALGMVLLANLRFQAHEALGLFCLWLAQFLVPHWREEICIVYAAWLALELLLALRRPGGLRAFGVFARLLRAERRGGGRPR